MFRSIVSALALCLAVAAGPGRAQVFDHSPVAAAPSSAAAKTRAVEARSAKTTLYTLIMTGNRAESMSIDAFRTYQKCRRARDIAADNLIFLGVNDQTKRQIYIWCDEPRASRRRNAKR